jgi:hypothetical protein
MSTDIKKRLDEIWENVSRGIFTTEDIEDFIKIKKLRKEDCEIKKMWEDIFGVYKMRLDEILENVIRGIFTIEDAEDFIKIEKLRGEDCEIKVMCKKIFGVYRWKMLHLAIPWPSIILGLLNEGSKQRKQLIEEAQKLYPRDPLLYEREIKSLVKDGFITRYKPSLKSKRLNEPLSKSKRLIEILKTPYKFIDHLKSWLKNEYEITEKGKVGYLLFGSRTYEEYKSKFS